MGEYHAVMCDSATEPDSLRGERDVLPINLQLVAKELHSRLLGVAPDSRDNDGRNVKLSVRSRLDR